MGYRVYLGQTYHSYHRTQALAKVAIKEATQADKKKDGRRGGSKGARQKAKLSTWSASKSASALKRKKNAITLPLARSG